ncbi:MAG: transglutaminase domain-containing protein, partial [Oscillospiraceae bacterium]|nr:transglutaminase domain-containing protein [Oscillospiraceae bacterium]
MKKHKGRVLLAAAAILLAALWIFRPQPGPAEDPSSRQILSGERSQLDRALLEQGVVAARYTGKSGIKLKVQITQPDGSDYNYDLNSAGNWERFPLTQGDGTYTVKVLEHIEGDRYSI